MLVHVAWNVRNVEVGVALIRELLELGIERFLMLISEVQANVRQKTYASKADLVAKEVEATNASLCIVEVVILDETKAAQCQSDDLKTGQRQTYPLHRPVLRSMIDFELWMSPKRMPQT